MSAGARRGVRNRPWDIAERVAARGQVRRQLLDRADERYPILIARANSDARVAATESGSELAAELIQEATSTASEGIGKARRAAPDDPIVWSLRGPSRSHRERRATSTSTCSRLATSRCPSASISRAIRKSCGCCAESCDGGPILSRLSSFRDPRPASEKTRSRGAFHSGSGLRSSLRTKTRRPGRARRGRVGLLGAASELADQRRRGRRAAARAAPAVGAPNDRTGRWPLRECGGWGASVRRHRCPSETGARSARLTATSQAAPRRRFKVPTRYRKVSKPADRCMQTDAESGSLRSCAGTFGSVRRPRRHCRTAMVRKGSPVRVRQRACRTRGIARFPRFWSDSDEHFLKQENGSPARRGGGLSLERRLFDAFAAACSAGSCSPRQAGYPMGSVPLRTAFLPVRCDGAAAGGRLELLEQTPANVQAPLSANVR